MKQTGGRKSRDTLPLREPVISGRIYKETVVKGGVNKDKVVNEITKIKNANCGRER